MVLCEGGYKEEGGSKGYDIVMRPVKINFSLKRPLCNMSGAIQIAYIVFNTVVDMISIRDSARVSCKQGVPYEIWLGYAEA